ncbi:MAG: GNAT family N-acetyltransferase [Nitrosopumilus sp.]|nr:GNAT family N-acetyltransferase [Nitrosopumilus sp.]
MFLIRKATINDAELLFNWANDEKVRANAIRPQKIVWDDHIKWLNHKLAFSHYVLILEKDEIPVGQIRFDFHAEENGWVITYSISFENRGKNWGKVIVALGMKYINKFPIIAYVRPSNVPSLKIFESLKFKKNMVNKEGTDLVKFVIDEFN